jgi:maltose alpha-D-glucosyltransferase/alpha-amylase
MATNCCGTKMPSFTNCTSKPLWTTAATDFNGLLKKLDYLEDLGVTAIWVLPFYPSPLRDDGYDIQDYYSINPSYGTVKHFKKFVKAARERNIRVITELVINHTSDQHPWFQRARRAPKGSVERDYYVWSDTPDKYKGVRIIFQDYEASNWTYDPVAEQYYWHRFFHHQPDLNYDNPQVQEEVFRIIDYWAGMGVDGFRLDAVPYLYQREGTNCENLPETHVFLKKLRKHIDEKFEGKMLLAEANMWPEDSASYFGKGDECHMNYHFPIMPRMFMAMRMENRYPIIDIFDQTPEIPDNCQWAIFLRNHDELTLEMVTDEERDYMYKVYAENPKAKINLGLRRRLAPLMGNNRRKIELINTLLFSLPGTPVLYYGDEIGMGDNFYLGDRDGVRTPMQWSPDRNGGFSKANPQQLYLPMILDPEYHYEAVNVEMQQSNGSSLLWWTKRIINMRKRFKAFSRGAMEFIHSENAKVLAFTRAYKDEIILVVVNLSRYTEVAELELSEYAGFVPIEVFSKNKFPAIPAHQDYTFTLSPHAYHWLQLTNHRVEHEQDDPQHTIEADQLQRVFTAKNKEKLEDPILPDYIARSVWFKSPDRKMEEAKILEKMPLKRSGNAYFLLVVEISYESGLPDMYQLGLAFGRKEENRVVAQYPQSIICEAVINGQEGYLCDALYSAGFQEGLFHAIAAKQKIKTDHATVRFYDEKKMLGKYLRKQEELNPRMVLSSKSNFSLLYHNDFYLKLYRKLDRAINPDLEIVRFASEHKGFEYIPKLVATIQLEYGKDDSILLGMMQEAVEYESDMWTYLLEFLKRYYSRITFNYAGQKAPRLKGSLVKPIALEDLDDDELKAEIGALYADQIRMLGERTAAFHLTMASDESNPSFSPEEFSLHYQRSLFSSFQSLVRHTFQKLNRKKGQAPDFVREEVDYLLPMRQKVLDILKKVYERKMDTFKIRVHGDFHLKQVLFTGQDFVFIDFEGETGRRYSERRIKRSPLRDIASMILSLQKVTFAGIMESEEVRMEDFEELRPWAETWYHYMSQFFFKAYLDHTHDKPLVPKAQEDLVKILNVFILERALMELEVALDDPKDEMIVPLLCINTIVKQWNGRG